MTTAPAETEETSFQNKNSENRMRQPKFIAKTANLKSKKHFFSAANICHL